MGTGWSVPTVPAPFYNPTSNVWVFYAFASNLFPGWWWVFCFLNHSHPVGWSGSFVIWLAFLPVLQVVSIFFHELAIYFLSLEKCPFGSFAQFLNRDFFLFCWLEKKYKWPRVESYVLFGRNVWDWSPGGSISSNPERTAWRGGGERERERECVGVRLHRSFATKGK